MKLKRMMFAAVAMVGVSALIANAVPTVATETWESDDASWQMSDQSGLGVYGSTDWESSLGGHSGVLEINGGASSGDLQQDYIYADSGASGGALAGNVNYATAGREGVQAIQFDFYANADTLGAGADQPGALSIFFLSSEGGGDYYWYYDLDVTDWAGWEEDIYAAFDYSAGWYSPGRTTEAYWNLDIQDVDQVGVFLTYQSNLGSQQYGLDNWQLDDIPEPGSVAVLAFALMSLGITFRGKVRESLTRMMKK